NGWTMQVQLIDLNATNLVARGLINHQFQPRRTAFSHDRVLSLSGWELLTLDVTNRDKPVLRGDLELAWSVDHLFVAGDYLLELSGPARWWAYQSSPSVRVSMLNQSDQQLTKLTLQNLPIVGACLKDNRLYVAHSQTYWYGYMTPAGASGGSIGS